MSYLPKSAFAILAGLLAAAPLARAQSENQGQGQAIVTVLPKDDKQPTAAPVGTQAVHIEANGKEAAIQSWRSAAAGPVELVVLIDDGARASLGREFDEIRQFVRSLPPNVKMTFAYMQNGRAALAGPLSANHAQIVQDVHLPLGAPGYSASPYFCLSDLAKNWPSTDRAARREVIMITDGVDSYDRRYDPDDPYVQAAIADASRAHLVVSAIYWRSNGRADASAYQNDAGQNLLIVTTQATGGTSYWQGFGNPVTLQPYFDDFSRRLNNQYELGFTAPLKGKAQIETLKIKVSAPDTKVTAPQQGWVAPTAPAAQ